MKELVTTAILIVGLYGGTKALQVIHNTARRAALEKAAKGLPPLPRFNQRRR